MRNLTFWLALLLTFIIPWEDSISVSTLGSVAKLVGWLVAACWAAMIVLEGRFRKPQLFHVLVMIFFFWNFISVMWSEDPESTVQRIKTYSQTLMLMLILWEVFQTPETLMAGVQAYIGGCYVLIASTIYNYMTGHVSVAYEGRYSATGVNANDLTLILLIGLPVAMQLFFVAGRDKKGTLLKLLNLVYIPLAIFSIILTGSRTSLIAIIPFGIFMVGAKQIQFDKKLFMFALLLLSFIILIPLVPSSLIERIATIDDSIGQGDLGGRLDLWREAFAVLARHPILGVGSGSIDLEIGSAVHNTFLSIAAETGLIGLTVFLTIIGVVAIQAMSLPKGTSGLWLAIFMTWAIGVFSLSWEFRKLTWILLNLVIIESSFSGQLKTNIQIAIPSQQQHPTREFISDPKVTG